MPSYLILQRFVDQRPALMPMDTVDWLLSAAGGLPAPGVGGATEYSFAGEETLAEFCTVFGDADQGVQALVLEWPRLDEALREWAWSCVSHLGCAVFDERLDRVHVRPNGVEELPEAMRAAALGGVRRVSGPQQFWPAGLERPVPQRHLLALRYNNVNPHGPHRQIFDGHSAGDRQDLHLTVALHPALLGPLSQAWMRHLAQRVDLALQANPGYRVSVEVRQPAVRAVWEADALQAGLRHPGAVHGPTAEALPPGESGFVADLTLQAEMRGDSDKLIEHVRLRQRVRLPTTVRAVRPLCRWLDRLRPLVRKERQAAMAAGQAHAPSRLARKWAVRAGAFLGEVLRHEVGGVWGWVETPGRHWVCLRLPCGRLCHPHLQVLDHILNGEVDDVGAWFQSLLAANPRRTPREDDFASRVDTLLAPLLAAAHASAAEVAEASAEDDGVPLPRRDLLAGARLDFSLDSLWALDAYLAQAGRGTDGPLRGAERRLLTFSAGAYVGEVLRRLARPASVLQWTNLADHEAMHPGFLGQRTREPEHAAFLEGAGRQVFPFAQVALQVRGLSALGSHAFTVQCLQALRLPPQATVADPAARAQMAAAREGLAAWRRVATRTDYSVLRAALPEGLSGGDALAALIEQQPELMAEGRLVWGALVPAGTVLAQPSLGDHVVALVYSEDPAFDAAPQGLRDVADTLAEAAGGQVLRPQPGQLGAWLADPAVRQLSMPLPSLQVPREVRLATTLLLRRQLAGDLLAVPWFPVLLQSGRPGVLPLPRRLWPAGLVHGLAEA